MTFTENVSKKIDDTHRYLKDATTKLHAKDVNGYGYRVESSK